MEIIRGIQPSAWKIIVYGTAGLGKSSLGAMAPKPLMIDLEHGLNRVEADKTPYLKTWPEVVEAMKFAIESDYKTIVFDTLDGMEQILINKILGEFNSDKEPTKHRQSLADWNYGHGYELLVANWSLFIKATDRLVAAGKNVLIIGHEQIQKFEDPSSDAYDRYVLKCHKKSAALLVAAVDAVLFAKHDVLLKAREGGFQKDKKRAVGDGSRVLHTVETPSWIAKNRFDLPPTVQMDETLFSQIK